MKDAKRASVTVAPGIDWAYVPHEHEELLRMADERRTSATGRKRQSTPLELRIARSNEATA